MDECHYRSFAGLKRTMLSECEIVKSVVTTFLKNSSRATLITCDLRKHLNRVQVAERAWLMQHAHEWSDGAVRRQQMSLPGGDSTQDTGSGLYAVWRAVLEYFDEMRNGASNARCAVTADTQGTKTPANQQAYQTVCLLLLFIRSFLSFDLWP